MRFPKARDFPGAILAGGLSVLFFLVLLWRDPLLFWNDDYALSILPVFADVARSWSEGQWPLLSPYSWVCGNLAGEFQYGTFSIFVNAVVVLIWQLPLSFPQQAAALSLAHILVLGAGGYMLARGRQMAAPLALMVGLIAALNGWIVCWGATNWFGALGAFAWLPWAWWGCERALDPARGRTRFLWPAPFVYLLITGGFPYTVVMLGLLAAFLALKILVTTKKIGAVLPLTFGVMLGVGLSAPAWLALLDYMAGSARAGQDASAHWQWLVPPGAWPGLVLPSWTIPWADFSTRLVPHTATELAVGIVAPAALLCGLLRHGREFVSRARWDLALLVIVFALAMLPTANVFRWSFRWLPFLHLVLALCAAQALQLRGRPAPLAVALVLLTGAAAWLAGAVGPQGWLLLVTLSGLAALWFLLERATGSAWLPAGATFASLFATFLILPVNVGVPRYNFDPRLTKAAPLDPARLYLSVYPPPESAYRASVRPGPMGRVVRPGSASMWGAVRFINGYSPIRPAGVATQFDFQIHGELAEWSAEYLPEWEAGPAGVLARIGVDGIIVARELAIVPQPPEEWQLAFEHDEGRVYHRRDQPLARIRSLDVPEFATAKIDRIRDSRHRVEADVSVPPGDKPARLIFSRPYFRGYRAMLDGQPLALGTWQGLVPSLDLPPGKAGRLVVVYRPWWLTFGGALAVGSLFVCLGGWVFGRHRRVAGPPRWAEDVSS